MRKRKTLFISFDLVRPGEIEKSYSIASILTFLKADAALQEKMSFHHFSINLFDYKRTIDPVELVPQILELEPEQFDLIAISAYVWNEYLLNEFISMLRSMGFRGKIILGGYQISYSTQSELPVLYPDCQVFVFGSAESSLKQFLKSDGAAQFPLFLNSNVDFTTLPSPYLTGEIELQFNEAMIRLETKRGCPYSCSFCAHRDLVNKKVMVHPLNKIFQELDLIKKKRVRRVNILDPVFNAGAGALDIMKEIIRLNPIAKFTLQSRFESIKGKYGDEFLDLCSRGNFHLEFGLQTANEQESDSINRKNRFSSIDPVFDALRESRISYEVSLIYGLPGQTVRSFEKSIDYLFQKGCTTIKAYPLMLLRGTEMFAQKEKWNLKEEILGDYNIPVVTSSDTFSRDEWDQMHEIASSLEIHNRF